ncbi:MAG: DNA-directed RNA polymerase subunit beta' [Candidatus Eisenbacteria bacterium]|nr:DNA-directed RNA polymerase subunit beta' [Candidatus Eisenbacteria bacterium]
MRVQLASPEIILGWSFGEVTKPETINYRSFKPEKDGLFCEKIFGPVKDWECNCGKYKRIRYRGVVCDRCGVEVTQAKVRRERLGHIKLAVPVSHIWYFKGIPSRIGHLLNMSVRDLERILYYESYVVIDPKDTPLQQKELLAEERYLMLRKEFGADGFVADMGAGAIKKLLADVNIEEMASELRVNIKVETSVQRKKETLKRLKVVEAFRQSGNQPDWMILDVIPVLPPDLRPLVPLEGGRFATSDLNDLYRRVINRNNRLKKLMEIRAPEVILRNEKRMLQEAVDALFDNGRRSRAVRGPGNRPLKSLSDMLKGKQGRFRQNLLGKRVDYSGRSVIVVGPELKLHQCGLPKNMALELFKPFIIKKLEDKGYVQTVKSAKKLVEREKPEVWDILEEIIKDHPVLLNRAPTLHRLGIQAFQPVLVEGKAIRIHPLVCAAFNADFDGDQMAVHVPLSFEAQIEARLLMLSSRNILAPASGKPVASPSQDIVLGCHFLTRQREGAKGQGIAFTDFDEAEVAYQQGAVELNSKIRVRVDGKVIETTLGRVIFNRIIPAELGFINQTMDKGALEGLVGDAHALLGMERTAAFLDDLKDLGFNYATIAGVTVGIDDIMVPAEKESVIGAARDEVNRIYDQYKSGHITNGERYNKVIDTWTRATSQVADTMFRGMGEADQGFNSVYMMASSGSRGSKEQIRQLAGMRGLMGKPQKKLTGQMGEIIESPILSNFKEGLSVLEYFISTHGARKGLADTALKTADAGYLTRRLVDVAQDVIITEDDCGTILGLDISALKEGEKVIEPLSDRILGRVAVEDVIHPISGETIVEAGVEIREVEAMAAEEAGIEVVRIRSVLTCESRRGVCAKCYGRNLANGRMVSLGEAVGVIAAQSIGEPGTQLTLRTFHIGGTAARIAEETSLNSKVHGTVRFSDRVRTLKLPDGTHAAIGRHGEVEILDDEGRVRVKHRVPFGARLVVKDGEQVEEGQVIFEWDPYSTPIISERKGRVKFLDIIDEVTVREELDDKTGLRQRVIIDIREKNLHPTIRIEGASGRKMAEYLIPTGARILCHDGDEVQGGEILAKIPREISKTRDITGGLPRVAELFEARKPKDAAVVTEIDGTAKFSGTVRGLRRLVVTNESGSEKEYLIPHGKHLMVKEGDYVVAGEPLSEGPINPHDILRIKGNNAVQEYLVNEIQEVYRLQGVKINDKHIETIVRQMLQKVRIEDPGDTVFLEGDQVSKAVVREENERLIAEGGKPATFQPLLLGITKASLSTESFVSAASFQETTRVLTEAAIRGATDNLLGLKENVIMGNLIPAGTGVSRCRRIRLVNQELPEDEIPFDEELLEEPDLDEEIDDEDEGGDEEKVLDRT